jgi:hypothetical protein
LDSELLAVKADPPMTAKPPHALKAPALAAVLSFLVPGLGHLYQGRYFKAALYSVCIFGTFFFGQKLGDWKVVYVDWHPARRTWAYVCQFWTGAVAIPPLLQSYRRPREDFLPQLDRPISTAFTGTLNDQPVSGQITLSPERGEFGTEGAGDFTGTLATRDGAKKVSGKLSLSKIEPPVGPDPERYLIATLEGPVSGQLHGSIPRGLTEWYGAPPEDPRYDPDPHRPDPADGQFGAPGIEVPSDRRTVLERAHAELGPRYELGVLYTMVAGLLSILCLFDALEGPAYESKEQEAEESAAALPAAA